MNPTTPALLAVLERRTAVSRVLAARGDALVITSLGNPTYDVAAAGDAPGNFYLWGAMGGAVMVALGVALARPERRVLAFVGDGELLMGLGSLATAAVARPPNLAVVVIDNERYAETGMQRAHSARGVDITGIAAAAGFAAPREVRTASELDEAVGVLYRAPGPVLVTLKVSAEVAATPVLPPRDGPFLRSRFRSLLLGAAAHE